MLQLDPKFPVDENDIKHNLLLNCNETKIYRDLNNEFKKIKFNSQLSKSDVEIINKFVNNILSPIITESNILWTSKFILNEIDIFYSSEKRINDIQKKLYVISPANCILKYFLECSYNRLLILVYHFWYESKLDDISFSKISKIIKCYINSNDFKKFRDLISINIFSKPEYNTKTKNGTSYFNEMKEYRNNLYVHITSKKTPSLTNKGSTKYVHPQKPNANILFHLANIIKIIANLFAVNDKSLWERIYGTIHYTPNLYFVCGGSLCGDSVFCIRNREEINLFYYIPQNWKEAGFM